jgi:Transposase DDE domain
MPRTLHPKKTYAVPSFNRLCRPLAGTLLKTPRLESRCNRPLQMEFEHQLKALIFFHLEEHSSGRHLIQALQQDDFARNHIAPPDGIGKSSFAEAMSERGLEQFLFVFQDLCKQASMFLPQTFPEFGELIAIDGTLIDAVLSMQWAEYRDGAKKAKAHIGFDLNRSIPRKVFLTEGNGGERPFVSQILDAGQTGVMDRGYQCHKAFDQWQQDGKHFVCRIKANTTKTCLETYPLPEGSMVFHDAKVLLGQAALNQTATPLRLVGYKVGGKKYWVATDRFDLTAEQIALIYKLRWEIEKFFAWWKRHLRVYHLISRSPHGLMIQILSGLITYLLLAIYCHEEHGEKVSIKRVRELRYQIQNETRALENQPLVSTEHPRCNQETLYASP